MNVIVPGPVIYTSLPEDGPTMERQVSCTLYRASCFHKGPYNQWIIELTEAEEEKLWKEIRCTPLGFDFLNRKFKGVPVRVQGTEVK